MVQEKCTLGGDMVLSWFGWSNNKGDLPDRLLCVFRDIHPIINGYQVSLSGHIGFFFTHSIPALRPPYLVEYLTSPALILTFSTLMIFPSVFLSSCIVIHVVVLCRILDIPGSGLPAVRSVICALLCFYGVMCWGHVIHSLSLMTRNDENKGRPSVRHDRWNSLRHTCG